MDISDLKDDLYELYRNRSSYWVRDIPYFKSSCSKILWKLGPVFTERETYGNDDIYKTETCGTCVATQVEGPSPGVQGIAKIRLQIPDDPENPSSTKPQRSSSRLAFEYYNHRTLTELGCTCIPKLLDYTLFTQKKGDPLPGGFLFILVMERLSGRNLVNFADLPMSERDQVRLAFAKSIRYTFLVLC
ncbi:hypothetical protein CPC735_055850 [Coccidioides posadasii C735 delta SOWgp]|uniref:Aminoglycoside phosphotransferase domain-containing protein n=1 Tax=Coccidioides posadasii (strain C735) TaxID=222929 RepID=C5PI62_COCP7|nr:hypothetical protein CPC735_055850 [Coccidioides posadasii C735 delta SOWgp]EER24215.1 hypothetical protein CPC735_055850 [Coccidioides posadasii C735 delta SOWgp]|eukprot:XP_003066360.1 hypothetical protein CPC735_055850 [Coccidioides posadasii C735 delta SOWgp]